MQHPVKPATQQEIDIANAYRFLTISRFEAAQNTEAVRVCMDKCIDTTDFFTCERANAPIKHRLETDLAEKKCVMNCGAKYDELVQMNLTRANNNATKLAEAEAMQAMIMMMGGSPP